MFALKFRADLGGDLPGLLNRSDFKTDSAHPSVSAASALSSVTRRSMISQSRASR